MNGMNEINEQLAEQVSRLVELCADLQRGDTLTYDVITPILGGTRHDDVWRAAIRKLKRRIEQERGITLWVVEPTLGYRLLTVQEQLTFAASRRVKRARKQLAAGLRHVESVPNHNLNAHQRRIKAAQIELARASRRQLIAQQRRQAALVQPTPTRPRPVVTGTTS